jgi:hypothetical protein
MKKMKIRFKSYDKYNILKIIFICLGVIVGIFSIILGTTGKIDTDFHTIEGTFVSTRFGPHSYRGYNGRYFTIKLSNGQTKEYKLPDRTNQDFDYIDFKDNVKIGDDFVLTLNNKSLIVGIKANSQQYLTPTNTVQSQTQALAGWIWFGSILIFLALLGIATMFEIKFPNRYRRSRHH